MGTRDRREEGERDRPRGQDATPSSPTSQGFWGAPGLDSYQADVGAAISRGEVHIYFSPCSQWPHLPRRWLTREGDVVVPGVYPRLGRLERQVNLLPSLPPACLPAGCDMCADNRNGECPMHGPLHSLRRLVGTSSAAAAAPPPELPEWLRDLPREVCLCTSTVPGLAYGICAAQRIQQGTWIGPFQGVLLPPEKVQAGAVRNTQHLWEVSPSPPSTLPTSRSSGRQRAWPLVGAGGGGRHFWGEPPLFSRR